MCFPNQQHKVFFPYTDSKSEWRIIPWTLLHWSEMFLTASMKIEVFFQMLNFLETILVTVRRQCINLPLIQLWIFCLEYQEAISLQANNKGNPNSSALQ